MNLPNVLTIVRLLLTILFIVLFTRINLTSTILALIVFTLAALTDFFDGFLARKYNWISRFGTIMDPIADKFLILSAFFIFTQYHLIAVWMFVLIFVREMIVTGLRLFAIRKGITLAAERAGKLKTVLQIISVYLIILFTVMIQLDGHGQWMQKLTPYCLSGIYMFVLIVVLVTLWSGFLFIWNNRREIFYVR